MSNRPLRLADLAEDAKGLSPEAFVSAHGEAFLLCHLSELIEPEGPIRTWSHGDRLNAQQAAALECLAFPIRQSSKSMYLSKITIGRTGNNDICIRDGSISKLHALISVDEGGSLHVADAGSKGGTWLDNEPVPGRSRGPGRPLSPGDTLRFGDVDTTFLDGEAVHSLVLRVTNQAKAR